MKVDIEHIVIVTEVTGEVTEVAANSGPKHDRAAVRIGGVMYYSEPGEVFTRACGLLLQQVTATVFRSELVDIRVWVSPADGVAP